MPQASDTKLFRKSMLEAGFRTSGNYSDTVFNDKHKDGTTRRLKLWNGNCVFEAPQRAQEALERALQRNFGSRYLFGQFTQRHLWWAQGKSFSVYLLTA